MHKVERVSVLEIFKIKKIMRQAGDKKHKFYSDFEYSITGYIFKKGLYKITKKKELIGFLAVNRNQREIYFLPVGRESISILRLLHIIKKELDLGGYKIILNYFSINFNNISKYFPVQIISNSMYMRLDDLSEEFISSHEELKSAADVLRIRNLIIDSEEQLRVRLQNEIFGNLSERRELTLQEVFNEERSSKFLRDFCFILEVNGSNAGYGQILSVNDHFFLVNFGLIPEYRGKGYSYFFLRTIIDECHNSGIDDLYLTVDKNNSRAIGLYNKMGFKEIYNVITLAIK